MNRRPRWFFTAASLALLAALASSCGKKTEPFTPDSPKPETVQAVKAAVRDTVAYLSWPVPTKNVEGKAMNPSEIEGFRIYRAEIERDRKRQRYKQIAEIFLENPAPAEVRNGAVFWSNAGLKYGRVYGYTIRALSVKGGISPPSDEVRAAPLLTVSPPKNLAAAGGDSHVMVSWDPVTTRMDGSRHEGFAGYNIYRGMEKGRYGDAPLNREPERTNSYKDTAVVNGKAYYYMVRSVDSPVLPWRESPDSGEATATPKDMTAPEKPAGLTVVPGAGRIFLTWNENNERDLEGYHVYRSRKSGGDYERLTDSPIKHTTFSDETVRSGTMYYYVVTAVDEAGNESPRSKEQKAFAERPR